MSCTHTRITVNPDQTLTCQLCTARMSRLQWSWSVTIGTASAPKVLIPASAPNPGVAGVPPWNDPRLDSVPTDDPMGEKEPEVQE